MQFQLRATTSLCVLVVLDVIAMSDAWFFFRRYPRARTKTPPNPRCSALAIRGDCDFYSCFEKRLSCGKSWYNLKYGEQYCRDFKAYKKTFSPKGQKFITDAQKCLGRELLNYYNKYSIDCHDYTHEAFRAMSRCYMNNGFCEVLSKDAINFVSVFQPQHLFQRGALKIWREIVRIAYHCEPEAVKNIIKHFFESWKNAD
jgi:hypothetical protein